MVGAFVGVLVEMLEGEAATEVDEAADEVSGLEGLCEALPLGFASGEALVVTVEETVGPAA